MSLCNLSRLPPPPQKKPPAPSTHTHPLASRAIHVRCCCHVSFTPFFAAVMDRWRVFVILILQAEISHTRLMTIQFYLIHTYHKRWLKAVVVIWTSNRSRMDGPDSLSMHITELGLQLPALMFSLSSVCSLIKVFSILIYSTLCNWNASETRADRVCVCWTGKDEKWLRDFSRGYLTPNASKYTDGFKFK